MTKRSIDEFFRTVVNDLPVLDRTSQPTVVSDIETVANIGEANPVNDVSQFLREVEYPADVNPQPEWGEESPPVRMVPRIQSDKKYSPPLEFRYNENRYLDEAREYIGGTYRAHYTTKSGGQVYDLIDGAGNGIPFSTSNIIKYAARFGKKGGNNRNDLLKVIHYATLALYSLDNEKA